MKALLFALFVFAMSSAIFSQTPKIEPGVSLELAKWRAAHYSDVRYKLNLTLEKMSPVLKGTIEIRVKLSEPGAVATGFPVPIILDWRKIKGHEVKSTISNVFVNGRAVKSPVATAPGSDTEHLIFRDGVVPGENVIKLDFTSPILTSGSAITRYVDKEDGSEYIYSLFVPSDASTAFPVFDQPDLKARFTLTVSAPKSWRSVVANSELELIIVPDGICGLPMRNPNALTLLASGTGKPPIATPTPTPTSVQTQPCELLDIWTFRETKPISTYVFAFAAGPWEKVSVPPALAGGKDVADRGAGSTLGRVADTAGRPVAVGAPPPANAGGTDKTAVSDARRNPVAIAPGSDKTAELSTTIYVRKSQAAKFKPHAAEVFRLNREAVKYFEQYFDYKFPFPKYDLVLIPEFPFGGMEHAGATFLRESSIIFPQEPTKNDYISRATLIFHETAHQWFGDTVTMRWFDDLWLKEGFATFMAYKAIEKIMPNAHAWKVFYERVKQAAYQTDSTRGTTAIYQPIANLSAAKSAYGNIVYNKAPAFLRQAEFYLGEDKFQTAVRAFLQKHEFGNAGWEDLVREFESASKRELKEWAAVWVKRPGLPTVVYDAEAFGVGSKSHNVVWFSQRSSSEDYWTMDSQVLIQLENGKRVGDTVFFRRGGQSDVSNLVQVTDSVFNLGNGNRPKFVFPNHGDYGYGIFLLDEKSRDYVLKNIQNEKDPFLRAMMWGALWDSVREGELDPRAFVELVVTVLGKNSRKSYAFTREPNAAPAQRSFTPKGVTPTEDDESTVALLLNRVGTAMNYYMSEPPALAGGQKRGDGSTNRPAANAAGSDLRVRLENLLIDQMQNAETLGQRITFYRAFLNIASSENARKILTDILNLKFEIRDFKLRAKDKFDIVTRLLILGDPDAPKLLAELEKTETSDDAKRYAYAAKAGIPTAGNKAKYWNDFINNKQISESWIEAAIGPWNSIRHSELTLPYLEKALQELPNHKRSRKIFFVNGWLGAFIGGQRSEEALAVVNKFLADNPNLDNDLRLKVLENVDLIERAVRIRSKNEKN